MENIVKSQKCCVALWVLCGCFVAAFAFGIYWYKTVFEPVFKPALPKPVAALQVQILDNEGKPVNELDFGMVETKQVFSIVNRDTQMLEWHIDLPEESEAFLSVNKMHGWRLRPGQIKHVDLVLNRKKLDASRLETKFDIVIVAENKEPVVKQMKISASMFDYTETEFGLNMQMKYVQGGEFTMGGSEEDSISKKEERPTHRVVLDNYYIGECEVTQSQWEKVMGTTIRGQRDMLGSYDLLRGVGDECPMYYVSWYEAVEFCEKLSAQTGKTYRLPTEAEWEYAARGGIYNDGTLYSGSDSANDVAVLNVDTVRQVGNYKGNGLGLFDMSGNVGEWCSDWYGHYDKRAVDNPKGVSEGTLRVWRGGSWRYSGEEARVSARAYNKPDSRLGDVGFRVVCEP